ncbi:hypothetical protein C8D87_11473 [Lentzea atacamensis]|uniref:Uncharacterized protein n=1 Tax=Lentzea atacamensis TaxID=531938 RepID=A0ABX9DVZ0_9PSEU|nr:hypothetical protein [Lentzea atacamensis]RAS59461.1 hypothetical protein C8D87_11473 [Lentzea atacamensis]
MGGEPFYDYIEGADLAAAFRAAVEQADHEHGLDSVFADKDTYVVIDDGPLSYADAEALAKRLIRNNDPRIDDRWGPLGAIAVRGGPRELWHVPLPAAPAGYPDDESAVLAAVRDHLADGETITRSCLHQVKRVNGRVYATRGATATATVAGAATVTGWYLVGQRDT